MIDLFSMAGPMARLGIAGGLIMASALAAGCVSAQVPDADPYGPRFLTRVLDGTGEFALGGRQGRSVNLHALAVQAATAPRSTEGEIETRHIAGCVPDGSELACQIAILTKDGSGGMTTEHAETYQFTLQASGSHWRVVPESVREFFAG